MLSERESNCREGIHIPDNVATGRSSINERSAITKAIAVPVREFGRNLLLKALQNNYLSLLRRCDPKRYYVKQVSVLTHMIGKPMR